MQFVRTLRDRIRSGEITCSVRLWQRPHVRVGGRYALPPGHIVVTALYEMPLADVTPVLARRSGFAGLIELLKVAKHGRGRRVFLVEFRYVKPARPRRFAPRKLTRDSLGGAGGSRRFSERPRAGSQSPGKST